MIDLETLLAQLSAGPSDADRQAARAQAAMAMGLGLLGTPGGRRNPWAGLAQGAAMGVGAYNDALAQARQRPLDRLKAAGTVVDYQSRGMDIKTKQAALDEAERQRQEAAMARDVLRGFRMPAPLPSMSPTNENAARLAATPRAGLFEKLSAQADALEAKGLVQQAQQYRTLAEKYAPQYEGMETVMRDGKPVVLQRFKNRAPEETGYMPKPDYKQVDTGGQIGFYDPLTGQVGGQFGKVATPDALLANEVARGNLQINRERLGLDRAKDAREQTSSKPQWDSSSGQFVYPPSAEAPKGRAVQPEGYAVKQDNKQKDASIRALQVLDEAGPLIKKATGSYLGAGIDMLARVPGKTTSGSEAIAQLQALEGALMLNQPRMEGPQSNLDVALYKQMAGRIGDPTVPVDAKLAALKVIRGLHERYTGKKGGSTGEWSIAPAN